MECCHPALGNQCPWEACLQSLFERIQPPHGVLLPRSSYACRLSRAQMARENQRRGSGYKTRMTKQRITASQTRACSHLPQISKQLGLLGQHSSCHGNVMSCMSSHSFVFIHSWESCNGLTYRPWHLCQSYYDIHGMTCHHNVSHACHVIKSIILISFMS